MSKLEPVFFGFVDDAGSIVVDEFCVSTIRNRMQEEVDVRNRNEPGANYRTVALYTEDDVEELQARNSALEAQLEDAKRKLATPVRLPEPCVYEVNGTMFYDRLSEIEVIASLREQGFAVEGWA